MLFDRVSVHASDVHGKKKRTSDQDANETFDQQGFKAHANNVLLRSLISTVSRESNSTAELTLM